MMEEPRSDQEETTAAPAESVTNTATEPSDEQNKGLLDKSIDSSPATTVQRTAAENAVTLVNRTLSFLSTASNETLGACFIGLGATTYLVLGRVGLVLIGVVGGIVLHAAWEGDSGVDSDAKKAKENETRKRRELGLEVVSRVWTWRNGIEDKLDTTTGQDPTISLYAGKQLDFTAFEPETAAALDTFTTAVIRDYVRWWYAPVLPGEESFPVACRQTLIAFLLSLSSHVGRKRPADMFLDFVTNSSSIVIVFLNELAAALNASPNSDAPTAIDTYLQLKPDCSLARVLDTDHQEKKLKMVAEDVLQNYLDAKAYNCNPVHVFLKQVLSKLILDATIQSCSRSEWINEWIVYLLEDGETELMQVIDASVDDATNSDGPAVSKEAAVLKESIDTDDATVNERPAHKRHMSRAEEAMDEAMQEAQRLTQLIVEEEKRKEQEHRIAAGSREDLSEDTSPGMPTPPSSQSGGERSERESREQARVDMVSPLAEPSTPTASTISTQQFTSFDQMGLPPQVDSDETTKPTLTLFKARLSIFDDAMPGEKGFIKSKPTADYLVQIEPSSTAFPGWMIARKYADFETLHEVLRRISVITGVRFTEAHSVLPTWRSKTKATLRGELERYLCDAVSFQQLAESEGMKRFLDKDQGFARSPSGNKGFGWPAPAAFDAMGKGMMDVLTKAPKEVAGGGKALFGGVTNVLGGKRATSGQSRASTLPINYLDDSYMGSGNIGPQREGSESRSSLSLAAPATKARPSTELPSEARLSTSLERSRPSMSSRRSSAFAVTNEKSSRSSSIAAPSTRLADEETYTLPPPPSMIDDYESVPTSLQGVPRRSEDIRSATPSKEHEIDPGVPARPKADPPRTSDKTKAKPPVTERETQVTIELLFAVITELYTLSSAWNIRRTLLAAAKTYLLRPGNPQLESIRVLIQESVLDANASDAGMAALILKVRENSLPTEEESKTWPAPMSDEKKEELRIKARKLLVERGMPQALTSVMGAAASGEAMGKVFDCLQIERVARSMIFGLTLQALRAVIQ